jgi:hypothetical protein
MTKHIFLVALLVTAVVAQDKDPNPNPNPDADVVVEKTAVKAIEAAAEGKDDKKAKPAAQLNTGMLAGAMTFRSVGPAFMSGRIGDVAIDQVQPNTWYVAVAFGRPPTRARRSSRSLMTSLRTRLGA